MNKQTEQILDKIIEAAKGNIIGFVVNIKTKKEFNIPDEYKGLQIGSDLLTPLGNIYSVPKP